MTMRSLLSAVFVSVALACAACHSPFSTHDEEPWVSHEVAAPSENVLWHVAGMSLEKAGFQLGTGADPTTLEMTSGWKTSLAPFHGDGHRERAHLRLTSTKPGHWKVELRIEKQVNEDMKTPMDPAAAQWKDRPDDTDTADLVMRRIRAMLGDELPADSGGNKPPAHS